MKYKKAYKIVYDAFEYYFKHLNNDSELKERYFKLFSKNTLMAVRSLKQKLDREIKLNNDFIKKSISVGLPVSTKSKDGWLTSEVVYEENYFNFSINPELISCENLNFIYYLEYISDRFNTSYRINFLLFLLENFTLEKYVQLKIMSDQLREECNPSEVDIDNNNYDYNFVDYEELLKTHQPVLNLLCSMKKKQKYKYKEYVFFGGLCVYYLIHEHSTNYLINGMQRKFVTHKKRILAVFTNKNNWYLRKTTRY
jgi:hypothetical protein